MDNEKKSKWLASGGLLILLVIVGISAYFDTMAIFIFLLVGFGLFLVWQCFQEIIQDHLDKKE